MQDTITAVACAAAMDTSSEEHADLVDDFVWVPEVGFHCASADNGRDGFLEIMDCDFPVRSRSPAPSVTARAGECSHGLNPTALLCFRRARHVPADWI